MREKQVSKKWFLEWARISLAILALSLASFLTKPAQNDFNKDLTYGLSSNPTVEASQAYLVIAEKFELMPGQVRQEIAKAR